MRTLGALVLLTSVGLMTACAPELAGCLNLLEPVPEFVADEIGRLRPEPADEISFIYDTAELRTFEIRLSEEDLATLDDDPTAEEYVRGTLVYDSTEYGPVGIRYKGSVGAFVSCVENSTPLSPLNVTGKKTCPKLSMKVSFNEFNPDGRFFGIKKLLFHSMNQDPSLMRERLGYELFREMGVPAPRAVHARLLINGGLAGLFANVEQIDGRFTRSRFADGEGNLYKEVWPTASSMQPRVTEGRLRRGLKTNEDEIPSVQKMLTFGRGASSEIGDERARTASSWMNVDNTMRLIAVDRTIRADDGPMHFYCGGANCDNHNFYFYEEETSNRVWLIPWDLDNSFVVVEGEEFTADTFVQVRSEWDDHSIDCHRQPGGAFAPSQMPPACDPLINTLGCAYHSHYDDALAELLEGPFSEDVVENKLTVWEAQIADSVAESHEADAAQLSPAAWRAGLSDLRRRIDVLRARASSR